MNKGQWGKVRAFFDLTTEEGFTIKGFKLIEGINGLFVGMPSQKGNDGEYYDSVFATKETKDQLNQVALEEYSSGTTSPETTSSIDSVVTDSGSGSMPPQESTEIKTEKTVAAENQNKPYEDSDIPF